MSAAGPSAPHRNVRSGVQYEARTDAAHCPPTISQRSGVSCHCLILLIRKQRYGADDVYQAQHVFSWHESVGAPFDKLLDSPVTLMRGDVAPRAKSKTLEGPAGQVCGQLLGPATKQELAFRRVSI